MRPRGSIYETKTEEDTALLESLRRVQRLSDHERRAFQSEQREYETREMRARESGPAIMTTSGLQTAAATQQRPAQQQRRQARAPVAQKPSEEAPPPADDQK